MPTEELTTIQKAKALLREAGGVIDSTDHDVNGLVPIRIADEASRLAYMALVQAQIATAEQLERIANKMPGLWQGGPR